MPHGYAGGSSVSRAGGLLGPMSDPGGDPPPSSDAHLPSGTPGPRRQRRTQDPLLDRLVGAIEREYVEAHEATAPKPEQQRTHIDVAHGAPDATASSPGRR
jgi:hypothetical protein